MHETSLGMATPMSLTMGLGLGAQNGILIRSGEALQIARGPQASAGESQADAGSTVAIELMPDQPGEYAFACEIGMYRGRLVME